MIAKRKIKALLSLIFNSVCPKEHHYPVINEKSHYNIVMRHQLFLKASALVFLGMSSILFCHARDKPDSAYKRLLPSVRVTTVKKAKEIISLSSIGTVKAEQGVTVSTEASGIITSINFKSGQKVLSGQTLVTLNSDDLKATVLGDEAQYNEVKLNEKRLQGLISKNYVSKQSIDQAVSQVQQAKAQLEHDESLLRKTIIKAPFSGHLGIRQVNLGQYVGVGQSIVSLQNDENLYIDFFIPESQSDLIHVGDKVLVTSHQGKQHSWKGIILALNSQMNDDSRSLEVRARLTPPYPSLIPGMYAYVTVLLSAADEKPFIPQTAIVYNPYGNFVYLYKKGVVIQRYVSLGKKEGSMIFVKKGLKVGDVIITEGQQKLFNGAHAQLVKS